jgi:uncharacterized membrane protein
MNFAHIHLVLNHAPIMGTGFGILVLLYGLARKSCEVVRASFLLFILSALLAVPTFFTGEPASEVLKGLPYFHEELSEAHKAAALIALIFVWITAVAALAALYRLAKKKECKASLTIGVLVIAVITLGFFLRAGQLGGKINHQELRPGFVMPPATEDEED